MDAYTDQILQDLEKWQRAMQQRPSITNKMTKTIQDKVNGIIPDKFHQAVTATIKQMTRAMIFGANLTTPLRKPARTFKQTEKKILQRIKFYRSTATVEGAVTGFGGFFWGLADFPLWLSLKMKMLVEIANYYGMDVTDYKERIFILHIFQLTFSSQIHKNKVFAIIKHWDQEKDMLPDDIHQFDWRVFQLEYRDYIDLAKLFQLIPGVGAAVGAYVNHRLTNKLGINAMNAYRLRYVATNRIG